MSKTFKTDLTGQKFNYLTVIEFYPTEKGESHSNWKTSHFRTHKILRLLCCQKFN